MVAGRKYWILIWYGILLLGVLGLWASVYWARRTAWKNVDEVLRGVGTILVSVGILLLLQPAGPLWTTTGEILLVDALICFVAAFILGRRRERERAARRSGEHVQPGHAAPPPIPPAEPVSGDTSSTTVPPHTS